MPLKLLLVVCLFMTSIYNIQCFLSYMPSLKNAHSLSYSSQKERRVAVNTWMIPESNSRRTAITKTVVTTAATMLGNKVFKPDKSWAATIKSPGGKAKCTDIDSCREIGEKRDEENLQKMPITKLSSGVRYKVLRVGTGDMAVRENSSIDIIYSISTASGQYMYSKGFGYENSEVEGYKDQKDFGIDNLHVVIGQKDVPLGIEQALVGMKKGERRRVELPPNVGFDTSNWKPEPTTRRGKAQITGYKRILSGFGSQPPFPAGTIWDIEVERLQAS